MFDFLLNKTLTGPNALMNTLVTNLHQDVLDKVSGDLTIYVDTNTRETLSYRFYNGYSSARHDNEVPGLTGDEDFSAIRVRFLPDVETENLDNGRNYSDAMLLQVQDKYNWLDFLVVKKINDEYRYLSAMCTSEACCPAEGKLIEKVEM